jgi:hypothetical protein
VIKFVSDLRQVGGFLPKCHEKYDVNSPEGKIYVRYSDRREEIHANFWADVKLEENYISPQDYYRQKLESN